MRSEVGHHEADIARMRSELSEQSSRTGNLRRQMESQRARITEIDAQTVQLHGELDAMLEQARTLSGQADSIAGQAEALRAKEALCMAQAAEKRVELSALRSGMDGGEERRAAALGERSEARAPGGDCPAGRGKPPGAGAGPGGVRECSQCHQWTYPAYGGPPAENESGGGSGNAADYGTQCHGVSHPAAA